MNQDDYNRTLRRAQAPADLSQWTPRQLDHIEHDIRVGAATDTPETRPAGMIDAERMINRLSVRVDERQRVRILPGSESDDGSTLVSKLVLWTMLIGLGVVAARAFVGLFWR